MHYGRNIYWQLFQLHASQVPCLLPLVDYTTSNIYQYWQLLRIHTRDSRLTLFFLVQPQVNKWAARLSVLATARLTYVLTYAVLHRTSTPVMVHRRQLRFAITGFNMLCLLVVETRLISSWRLNLLVQILGKLFVPTYFVFCVAVDSSSDFRPLPTKAKVWEAHENWHVVILVLHLLQFYAVSTHVHGLSAGVWKTVL